MVVTALVVLVVTRRSRRVLPGSGPEVVVVGRIDLVVAVEDGVSVVRRTRRLVVGYFLVWVVFLNERSLPEWLTFLEWGLVVVDAGTVGVAMGARSSREWRVG